MNTGCGNGVRKKRTEAELPCAFSFYAESVTPSITAAAKNDEGNNDDPAAVVVTAEKSADTVVVHNRSSLVRDREQFPPPCYYCMAVPRKGDRNLQKFAEARLTKVCSCDII